MDIKVLESLSLCPLFSGFEKKDIEATMADVRYRIIEYSRHDIYALAGMPCRNADIIIDGTLVCRMSATGKQVEVSRLHKGNIVAPAFLFGKDNGMPVGVETDTPVTILRISKEEFGRLLETNYRINANFIRILSNINVFLTRRMRILSLFSVREKVAWFLFEIAAEQGSSTIHLSRSRQEIADSFGIQKFSLLRVLSDFQKEGAIKINGKEITILDRNKMK